jgi:hypothetical protein
MNYKSPAMSERPPQLGGLVLFIQAIRRLPDRKAQFTCSRLRVALGWDWLGPTMRSSESPPLWVWLTIGLMAFGCAAYVTSYFMIEDFMAFLK